MTLIKKNIYDTLDAKGSDADLIWSGNFQQSLLQRQKERAVAAQTRADQAMADALRAELESAQGGEVGTIEEGDEIASDDDNA